MANIDFGQGPGTATGDKNRQALVKLQDRVAALETARAAEIAALNSTIGERDSTIATRNATIANLNAQIATLNARIAELEGGGGSTPPAYTPPVVVISAAQSQNEGATFTYTLTRTGDLSKASSVAWSLTGVSAGDLAAGQATSGTASFPINATTATIVINTLQDTVVEPNETFTITLSSPFQATLGSPASATGTILNEDTAPTPEPAAGDYSAPLAVPSATPTAYPPSVAEFYLQPDHKPAYSVVVYTTSDYAGTTVTHTATVSVGAKTAAQMRAAVNAALAGFGITTGTGFIRFRVDNGTTQGTPSEAIQYGTTAVPTIVGSKTFENVEGTKLSKTIALNGPARNVWLVGQDRDQVELLGNRPGDTFTLRWTGDKTQEFYRAVDFNRDAVFDIGIVVESLAGVTGAAEALTITVLDLDELPAPISFTTSSDQELNTVIESSVIEVASISEGVVLSGDANGEQFRRRRNGTWGAYGTAPQDFILGDGAQIRTTTSNGYLGSKTLAFDLGPISANWSVSTKADPNAPSVSLVSSGSFLNYYEQAQGGSDVVTINMPEGRHILHVFVENNANYQFNTFGNPFTVRINGVDQVPLIRNASPNLNTQHSVLYDVTAPAGGIATIEVKGGEYRGAGAFAIFKPTAQLGAVTGSVGIPFDHRSGAMQTPALDVPLLALFLLPTAITGVTLAPQNGEVVRGNYIVQPNGVRMYWGTKTADGPLAVTVNNPQGNPHDTGQSLFGIAFGAA